jgi:hypothetical protein
MQRNIAWLHTNKQFDATMFDEAVREVSDSESHTAASGVVALLVLPNGVDVRFDRPLWSHVAVSLWTVFCAQIEHLIQTNTWSKFKCTVTYRLCCFAVHLARSLRGDAADNAMDAAAAAELEVRRCVGLWICACCSRRPWSSLLRCDLRH